MTVGDQVRASFPYAGVPACPGNIISELVLGTRTQYLVRFEVRPRVFKNFYLTERELTLAVKPDEQISATVQPSPRSDA
jgi:hypothetical protein